MISILKLIFSLLNKKSLPPAVMIGQNITNTEVRTILTPFTTNLWLSDDVFETINTKNLQDFLAIDDVSNLKYTINRDCDDFSYMLMGALTRWYPAGSIGIVWGLNTNGGSHAWNFFINENKELKFIEPQTDQIFEPSSEKIWVMII